MPARRKLRRAGSKWRILVHEYIGHGRYGDAFHVSSDKRLGGGGEDHSVEADGRTKPSRRADTPLSEYPPPPFSPLTCTNRIPGRSLAGTCWSSSVAAEGYTMTHLYAHTQPGCLSTRPRPELSSAHRHDTTANAVVRPRAGESTT
jgi:hypothetical protein